jgi:hypothetical protein
MFSHNFQESLTNIVEIKGIVFEVFREMLRFAYCGKVENLHEMAYNLLQAARSGFLIKV